MARKTPSSHSVEQFALFTDRVKNKLNSGKADDFDRVVRNLINLDNGGFNGGVPTPGSGNPRLVRLVGSGEVPTAPSLKRSRSTRGNLPDRPDFDAIEKAARETSASRANLLTLIGQLVFSWSNNESLLIYVLMLLLRTDEASAAVVFSTLNTTRARVDLVQRLAQISVNDRGTRSALDRILKQFNDANRVRNEFMHAMYTVNTKGEITHTQVMRLVARNGKVSFGDQQPIDAKRLALIVQTCSDLRRLNREIWDLLPILQNAVDRRAALRCPPHPSTP